MKGEGLATLRNAGRSRCRFHRNLSSNRSNPLDDGADVGEGKRVMLCWRVWVKS